MLFWLRRNTVGISGAKFDVVEEGCKPMGITRRSEFAEKSCPAQTYLGRCPGWRGAVLSMADLLPTTARGLKVVVGINFGVLLNARLNTQHKPRIAPRWRLPSLWTTAFLPDLSPSQWRAFFPARVVRTELATLGSSNR